MEELNVTETDKILREKLAIVSGSHADEFLLRTAHLVEPSKRTNQLGRIFLISSTISISGFISFGIWLVSGDPIWCARYLVLVIAVLVVWVLWMFVNAGSGEEEDRLSIAR